MEELNFPVFDKPLPPAPILSMNDYVKFVQMYRPYLFNREVYEEWKKRSAVNVPFKL